MDNVFVEISEELDCYLVEYGREEADNSKLSQMDCLKTRILAADVF